MAKLRYIIIVMVAAFVGGLLLYTAPLFAADPTPLACPNGQTVFLEGHAPSGESVLAYLRGRPVGGGLADGSGHYRVPLRAQERAGVYPVEVRLRSSRAVVGTFTCFVDVPIDADPTLTATLGGATPAAGATRVVPTSPPVSGSTATSTGVTSSPTSTGTAPTATGTARTPAGSTTPTATLGTTTPTKTTTANTTGNVVIRMVYLRDPTQPDDTDEFVEIENTGSGPINLTGWKLSNLTRSGTVPTFVFPSYTLDVNSIIVVYSVVGDNDVESGEFFWDQSDDIWKVGEVAELRDSQNHLISTLSVPAQ